MGLPESPPVLDSGHSEFPGDVDYSSIELFPWARGLKLLLFEVAEDRIIGDAEHDVVGLDV